MTTIKGSRALITGGASGIGLGLAKTLAAQGAEVVLWDIHQGPLDAAVAEIERAGGRAEGTVVDVTNREAVYAAARSLLDRDRPIDILVNNAGVVTGKTLLESPDAMIERTMAVNAISHFWTVKAFLPSMLERDRGHVVTIASAAGMLGVNRLVDYCASKHAAVGFDEGLRVELKQRGSSVRTTVVCPYFINTHMFTGAKSRYPALLPILDQDYVVARMARAIERDQPRLIMPELVRWTYLLRIFPLPFFDWFMDRLGVHAAMDQFGQAQAAAGAQVEAGASAERRPSAGGADRSTSTH